MKTKLIIIIITFLFTIACNGGNEQKEKIMTKNITNFNTLDTAVFAAGCFWCVEAIFQNIKGVAKVESGYSGGETANPTYQQVCTGNTGHAEAARIYFDTNIVSFTELLEVFWGTHDPTTLNQQGADVGTQYRSAIFYINDSQKDIANAYKNKLNEEQAFGSAVLTEISPLKNFYIAEDYHQNYYNENSNQSYCSFVIKPKLDKLHKIFKEKLK